ncbi:Cilia- and flagella-associated protein 20 [Takifugu flavidus]|uniref:Cilia-and flagella-associated protein 20 n=1 Tax=Takifugu flavidus TaxID=433684 RepID=A0A5C6MSX4_9TELE|nr:Cilia- and flagella-associated protein 20 [Takifugu flavidus]
MQSTSITCPPDPEESLGIRLPCLNLLVKKTGEDWGFELTIYANCRIRRVYFTDRLYSYHELPSDYKVKISIQG